MFGIKKTELGTKQGPGKRKWFGQKGLGVSRATIRALRFTDAIFTPYDDIDDGKAFDAGFISAGELLTARAKELLKNRKRGIINKTTDITIQNENFQVPAHVVLKAVVLLRQGLVLMDYLFEKGASKPLKYTPRDILDQSLSTSKRLAALISLLTEDLAPEWGAEVKGQKLRLA